MRKGEHPNVHLQRAWDKHGKSNFKFDILEITENSNYMEKEQWYLDNKVNFGEDYNIATNVFSGMKGRKASVETRRKLSESRKGKKNHNFGKVMSDETKKKISDTKRSQKLKLSEDHKLAISKALKGRILSKESRKQQGETFKKNYKKENHPCYGITGEKHPTSKLTQRQADEIRQKYVPHKYTQPMLAKEYDVSVMTISQIVYNKTYLKSE